MNGFDKEKFYKKASEEFVSKVDKDINLRERYTSFDEASEDKKQRIRDRDERKQKRFAEHKERVDAKRQRYADKMEGKGILTREQAMGRFDNLKGIKARSAEILQNTLSKDGEAPTDENGDRKTGFSLNQEHISQGMSDLPEDPVYNESNPASRFMLDSEGGFGDV
jgi:hypothetical protein